MTEALSPLVVVALGVVLVVASLRAFSRPERRLLVFAFVVHVFAAMAQVWITRGVYGGGDMMVYFYTGSAIADLVPRSPGRALPELWKLLVHEPSSWPFYVMGNGSTTGTMSAISGVLQIGLGESIHAVCLALSTSAYFGQLAFYRALREVFPATLWRRLLVATMLVPSVVFWSSGILKETVVVAGLGWIVLGLQRLTRQRSARAAAMLAGGAFVVSLAKAYVLFALVVAGGVWWYWRRSLRAAGGRGVSIRPAYMIVGAGGIVGGMVVLGELFPRYAFDQVGEEAARLQEVGGRIYGGSNYEIVDTPERSLVGQLAYAPLAIVTALFRPFLFEIRNAMMAVNALETTTLLALFVRAGLRRGPRAIWGQISRSPLLAFGLTFVAAFGVAVGLATTNLGTLSRYRIPMMPLFATLLLVLDAPRVAATPRPVPAPRRRRSAARGAPAQEASP